MVQSALASSKCPSPPHGWHGHGVARCLFLDNPFHAGTSHLICTGVGSRDEDELDGNGEIETHQSGGGGGGQKDQPSLAQSQVNIHSTGKGS